MGLVYSQVDYNMVGTLEFVGSSFASCRRFTFPTE